jgi:SAM-dependent methyltransferase
MHEDAQRAFFERQAHRFDRRLCRSRWPRNLTLKAQLISNVLAEAMGGRVVEIGCGPAQVADQLLAAHPRLRYVGVDLSPAMLAIARQRLTPYSDRVTLMVASDDPAAYGDSFAGAFGIDVLHHIAEPVGLLRGLASTLRPDAPVVFLEANALFPLNAAIALIWKEERGTFRIRPENLRRWLDAAGFVSVDVAPGPVYTPPGPPSVHRALDAIDRGLTRTPLLRSLALQLVARGRTQRDTSS